MLGAEGEALAARVAAAAVPAGLGIDRNHLGDRPFPVRYLDVVTARAQRLDHVIGDRGFDAEFVGHPRLEPSLAEATTCRMCNSSSPVWLKL